MQGVTQGQTDPFNGRSRRLRKMPRKSCQVFSSVLSRFPLYSSAVAQFGDYVLNEGDEFVPSMWVRPRRLMLRLGLEY